MYYKASRFKLTNKGGMTFRGCREGWESKHIGHDRTSSERRKLDEMKLVNSTGARQALSK